MELPPARAMPRALVIGEEESPVVDDRAAGRAAELVLMERRALRWPAALVKKLLASSSLLRRNSNTVPWN